jgi:putative transposase
MPFGLERFQQSESLHFITFSCFDRLPFLSDPQSLTTVEAILERTRSRHQARIYAYVLMPEHVHLLINEPPAMPLDQFIKAFKQETSKLLKGERKHFWLARYYDRNVRGEREHADTIGYIHHNPVDRKLVQSAEQYEYSSFNHYRTGHPGVVEIESEWTAAKRDRLRAPSGTFPSRFS